MGTFLFKIRLARLFRGFLEKTGAFWVNLNLICSESIVIYQQDKLQFSKKIGEYFRLTGTKVKLEKYRRISEEIERLMNNQPEPTNNYCASENLDLTSTDMVATGGGTELSSGKGTFRASKTAASIGLAISMGAAGILLDSGSEVMAAEAKTSNQNLTELSNKNKLLTSSVTSAKLTVKSSVNRRSNTSAKIHKARPGETLASIAIEYDLTPEDLAAYNGLTAQKKLKPGQMLKIPAAAAAANEEVNRSETKEKYPNSHRKNLRSKQLGLKESLAKLASQQPEATEAVQGKIIYKVRQGDTLGSIASRHGISITQLVRENKITNPDSIDVDLELVITPGKNPAAANRYVSRVSENRDKEKLDRSSPVFLQEDKASDLSNTNRVNPYVAKLRADIQELQQGYKAPDKADTPAVQSLNSTRSNTPVSAKERLSSSEWLKQRLRSRGSSQTNENLPMVSSLRNSVNSNTDRSQPQLINSVNTNKINPNLRARVSPELPSLSTAEEYLPDSTLQSKVGTFRGYTWPATGRITSGYGWRWGRLHKGVDIAGPVGTPILAAAPGQVIYAGWNSGGFGNLVKVRHYDGSVTLYAHNSRILVRRGQTVTSGQMIARMGSTGFSTGPHLHFEIHRGRGAVNPMAYLPRKR